MRKCGRKMKKENCVKKRCQRLSKETEYDSEYCEYDSEYCDYDSEYCDYNSESGSCEAIFSKCNSADLILQVIFSIEKCECD